MFKREQIKDLFDLFDKRDVKLYHSAQYQDFKVRFCSLVVFRQDRY